MNWLIMPVIVTLTFAPVESRPGSGSYANTNNTNNTNRRYVDYTLTCPCRVCDEPLVRDAEKVELVRDAEKVEQLVSEALNNLRDAAAFEWAISDKGKALFVVSIHAVETLFESLPRTEHDPNNDKYTCQPYGVEKCGICLYPFDECGCDE